MQGFVPQPQLVPNVAMKLYAGPPVGKIGLISVRLCNRGGNGPALCAIAITRAANAAGITASEWISFDRSLPEKARYAKENLLVMPGESLYVRASHAAISARAQGFEHAGTGSVITAAPAANTPTLLFAAAAKAHSGNVIMVNRANALVKIRIAITSAAINAIPDSAWITYDTTVPARGEAEDQALVVEAGEKIYYIADAIDTSVRAAFALGDV